MLLLSKRTGSSPKPQQPVSDWLLTIRSCRVEHPLVSFRSCPVTSCTVMVGSRMHKGFPKHNPKSFILCFWGRACLLKHTDRLQTQNCKNMLEFESTAKFMTSTQDFCCNTKPLTQELRVKLEEKRTSTKTVFFKLCCELVTKKGNLEAVNALNFKQCFFSTFLQERKCHP